MNNERINTQEHIPPHATELWFRLEQKEALQNKELTSTIRVGDRTESTVNGKGGYPLGSFIALKLHSGNGTDFDEFAPDVLITKVHLKKISELTPQDLIGGMMSGLNTQQVAARLNELYGRVITEDEDVTVVVWEYKDDIDGVKGLLNHGVIGVAQLPPNNPENLKAEHYTVPLIEHDYPAKTPVMWNAAYKAFDIDAASIMVVGDPSQSPHILDILRADDKFRGGGAGVGFKDEAVKYVDSLDPLAEAIGSINFILKNEKGELVGYNTDGLGYAMSLQQRFEKRGESVDGKKIVMLGAGGTGNAIAFALVQSGAKLTILNRTVEKAQALADRINTYFNLNGTSQVTVGGEDLVASEVTNADAIINVSTKGSSGSMEHFAAFAPVTGPADDDSVIAQLKASVEILKQAPKEAIISDIVIVGGQTPTLAMASELGFEVLDGIPMVVNQGVEAFWLLYGKDMEKKGITKEQVSQTMAKAAGLSL